VSFSLIETIYRKTGATLLFNKYRPRSLDEITCRSEVIQWLRQYEDPGRIKRLGHVFLYGPSGTGKTLIVNVFVHEFFWKLALEESGGDEQRAQQYLRKWLSTDYLEVNASTDDIRRFLADNVISAYMTKAATNPSGVKFLFLDEFDLAPEDAQRMLRRPLEDYSHVKVFIAANHPENIHFAILSRVHSFYVPPYSIDCIMGILRNVISAEGIEGIDDDKLRKIAEASGGDARRALTLLGSLVVNNVYFPALEKYVLEPERMVGELLNLPSPETFYSVVKNIYLEDLKNYVLKHALSNDCVAKMIRDMDFKSYEDPEVARVKWAYIAWRCLRPAVSSTR